MHIVESTIINFYIKYIMKPIAFIAGLLFTTTVFALTLQVPASFKQSDIFQNWLQSRCIGNISPDTELRHDAFKSAAAWLEVSQLPVGAFNEGDTLIDNALKIKLSGSTGGEFKVLKCSLISQSKEAKEIFNKYSK